MIRWKALSQARRVFIFGASLVLVPGTSLVSAARLIEAYAYPVTTAGIAAGAYLGQKPRLIDEEVRSNVFRGDSHLEAQRAPALDGAKLANLTQEERAERVQSQVPSSRGTLALLS